MDKQGIHNCGRHRAMAKQMLFNPRCVYRLRKEIQQSFAVREKERRIRMNLSPNEQVFSRKRDLFVSILDIGADRRQYAFLWQVHLRA